jgi:hypothetical protein
MIHFSWPWRRRWFGAFAAAAGAPGLACAQTVTATPPDAHIATLLQQRLAHEGVGLVAA